MTGGGFGGCTINLVNAENVEEFKRTVAQGYTEATGLVPEIYVCSAAEGAEEIIAIANCRMPIDVFLSSIRRLRRLRQIRRDGLGYKGFG